MALLRSLDDQIRISIEENQNLLVGRIPECDVILEDGSVSSQHARLKLQNHVLVLNDLDSTNGTRVNYALVQGPTLILDGDTIEFGNVTFTVDAPELCSPGDMDIDPKAMTSLEPIDASQAMDNTMRISGLEEIDPEEERPFLPPEENSSASPSRTPWDPVKSAFAAAILLILLAGALLLSSIAKLPLIF